MKKLAAGQKSAAANMVEQMHSRLSRPPIGRQVYARSLAGQVTERYQRIAGRQVEKYSTDANGAEHKEKGKGGGQYTAKSGSEDCKTFHREESRDIEQRKFLEGPPVISIRGNEVPDFGKGNVSQLVAWVGEWFKKEHGSRAVSPELGKVRMDENCASESLAHGTGPLKSSAFVAVPAIIANGKVIGKGKGGKTGLMETYAIGVPIEISGEPYAGVVLVRKDENGQSFYVHEVRTIKMLQAQRSIHGAPTRVGRRPGAGPGAIDSLLREIFGVKDQTENKPQTGKEPYARRGLLERMTRQVVQRYAQAHDVSDEARAADGTWTAGARCPTSAIG